MPAGPSANTRAACIQRDGLWCRYCLRAFTDDTDAELTLDHLIPRSRGGSNGERNLVVSCRRCNQAKGPAMLEEIGWFLFPSRYLEGRSLDNLTPELRELRSHCLRWSGKRSVKAAPPASQPTHEVNQGRLTQQPFADLASMLDRPPPPPHHEFWKSDYWVRALAARQDAEVVSDAEWERKRKNADKWNAAIIEHRARFG